MKTISTLFFIFFFTHINSQTKQIHIPVSESIIGIWRQTGIVNPKTDKIINLLSGNYKLINPDGTYFTFISWGTKDPKKGTTIGHYGSYEITSDSTMIENINKHVLDPSLNSKSGKLKYKLINKTTLMIAWKNKNGKWINEQWTRLPLSQ